MYLNLAKIIILYVLVQYTNNNKNKKSVVAASILLTIMLSLYYLYIDVHSYFFTGEGDLWASLGKIAAIFFPALIYFGLLSRLEGLFYWLVMGTGILYFVVIL